jgi:hypothetical protein
MKQTSVSKQLITSKIHFLRGERVVLDFDLALLYSVETKHLKRQVRRNIDRFPSDFMFQLNASEYESLRSQIGTLKRGGHSKYLPYAFTEHGVTMISGILNTKAAIQVNIMIVRTFVALRRLIESNKELAEKIRELEGKYDSQFKVVFDAIRQLTHEKSRKSKPIGFKISAHKR